MTIRLPRSILNLALTLAVPAAFAQTATPAVVAPPGGGAMGAAAASASPPVAAPADYRLSPGDSIKVQVYQNPELGAEVRVAESGVVNYPLIGAIQLGGLTIAEAETRLAAAFRQKDILKSPQVNINVLQVRGSQVAVVGQVAKPGRFPLETTNVRVSDILAASGGITKEGDDVVVVTGQRNNQPFRKSIDVAQLFAGNVADDILLKGGDTIYVGKAPTYYIYGEAQKPGNYKVERGMTVMQAIAAGGGVTNRGSQNRVRLTRTDANGRVTEISPRLTDPVQPGDVLFVRESLF